MDLAGTADEMSTRVSRAAVTHEYSELDSIIENVFAQPSRLELLIELAKRLSTSAFDNLCLRGLRHLIDLKEKDYRTLFDLASAHDIALYNLTRFLLIHGRAKRSVLRRLCANFAEIEHKGSFNARLEEDGPLPNEERMTNRIYGDLDIPIEVVSRFRQKFSDNT